MTAKINLNRPNTIPAIKITAEGLKNLLSVRMMIDTPARKNYQRRHVDIRGIDETRQAGLVEMQPYEKKNKGYKYILTIIDIFSKFAWAVLVKSKKGEDVTAAMKSLLDNSVCERFNHTIIQ